MSQALGVSTFMYRMRNIWLLPSQSSTRSLYPAMLSLPRGLIWCRPAHDVVFLKQSQFCSHQTDFSHRRWEVPTPLHTHSPVYISGNNLLCRWRRQNSTDNTTFLFGSQLAALPRRVTLIHVICHQHNSHFPGYCLTSIKETSFVFKECCLSRTCFSSRTVPTLPWTQSYHTTDVSACPQHRLLRKEKDHQNSIYALTALALKPTSWTKNMYCAHFPTSFSLITGTRFIPFQLQPGSDNGCTSYDPEKQLPLLPLFSHQDTRTKLTLNVDSPAKDICTYPHSHWPGLGRNFLVTFDRNTVTPQRKLMLSMITRACRHFTWDKLKGQDCTFWQMMQNQI